MINIIESRPNHSNSNWFTSIDANWIKSNGVISYPNPNASHSSRWWITPFQWWINRNKFKSKLIRIHSDDKLIKSDLIKTIRIPIDSHPVQWWMNQNKFKSKLIRIHSDDKLIKSNLIKTLQIPIDSHPLQWWMNQIKSDPIPIQPHQFRW